MLIEQAVFTSVNVNQLKGYQLTGRSGGIEDRLAQALCRWSPSHGGLWGTNEQAESINFFQIGSDWHVLSRSIFGGPEYSRRAGQRVYTKIMAFGRKHLAAFQHNCMALARTAQSLGLLTLDSMTPQTLPPIELPDQPFVADNRVEKMSALEGRIANLVENELPVAVIGVNHPIKFMTQFIPKLPISLRLKLSFCTGLNLTEQRPFAIQFFPECNSRLKSQLSRLQISTVDSS